MQLRKATTSTAGLEGESSQSPESQSKILPMTPDTSLQFDERKEKFKPLTQVQRCQLKKKALHTIKFSLELRALVYIMIFNLYLMQNLTTLSGPRTIFLHDLFIHKEIDICGHIYHLFVKCIKKRKSRITLPFPSLVMSLISRVRVKIPSGLPVMQREEPISEHTIIRRVKLTFLVQKLVHLKFHEMMQKKLATPKRRLIDSLLYQRILYNLLLKHRLEHPTALIFYLEGQKKCTPC